MRSSWAKSTALFSNCGSAAWCLRSALFGGCTLATYLLALPVPYTLLWGTGPPYSRSWWTRYAFILNAVMNGLCLSQNQHVHKHVHTHTHTRKGKPKTWEKWKAKYKRLRRESSPCKEGDGDGLGHLNACNLLPDHTCTFLPGNLHSANNCYIRRGVTFMWILFGKKAVPLYRFIW